MISNKASLVSGLLFASLAASSGAVAEIIWTGDYENGDYLEWSYSGGTEPNFSGVPQYGRPTQYGGDGSLLSLVTSPVRNGRYASRFTVKNSANGTEPADCQGMPDCERRIVALKGWYSMESSAGTVLPYGSERWLSVSHYIPADWDTNNGGGWGPIVYEMKPYINNSKVSPFFSISLNKGGWVISHRQSDEKWLAGQLPWQRQMFYAGEYEGAPYPNDSYWADGVADFPNMAQSHAALRSINKGGWTDWVIHIRFDARGAAAGGQGFLRVYKREDSGSWIEVLDIRPRNISRGGMTFDRGIGYNSPARDGAYSSFGDHGGFAIVAGMYMDKGQVWGLPNNRVIYNDNIKVGDERSSLAEMAPGGGGGGGSATPFAPPPEPAKAPPKAPVFTN